jgi:hypothetical protein
MRRGIYWWFFNCKNNQLFLPIPTESWASSVAYSSFCRSHHPWQSTQTQRGQFSLFLSRALNLSLSLSRARSLTSWHTRITNSENFVLQMLTVYVSQTQTTTENIRDFQSTSYDIASGETKGFCSSGLLKCLFLRLTHVFIFHIFSSHLHLFSLQSVPSCLDSTTLYRVRVRARTHTLPTHSLTHSLARTHTHITLYENSAQTAAAEVWSWNGYKCECLPRCLCWEVPSARYFLMPFWWLQSFAIFRYYNSIKWYLAYPADANWYACV